MESHKEQQIQNQATNFYLNCDICRKTFKTKMEILQHRQVCFRGIKLGNKRGQNNCYVNVCINSLASVSKITDTIMTSPLHNSEITDIFKKVILTKGPHNVRDLKTIVDCDKFDNNLQHDACEFLELLLGKLIDSLPYFSSTFSFTFDTIKKCKSGHYKPTIYGSSERILRLPVVSNNTNIQSLLKEYFQPQLLDETCNVERKSHMLKTEKIQQPPIVLFIQLLRFDYLLNKNENDVSPSTMISFCNKTYRLQAIIEHHGNTSHVGHYKTVMYLNNTCVVYDDDKIFENNQPDNSTG